ncbi:trehalase-like isoform X2 [Daktulosphaira vitifoliae]|uniref:trehalase-like isoform X1 n=1 Tax=Daktulosphaira vitifoliae TaxID=58002 RepID=UPI0021A992FB|nr:trehalase-like isoform X1 [Daktulosphaira vitifoliae]XP_050538012.1 trehalase-like isoform X2 [Daktulosphaira vitifoliae]
MMNCKNSISVWTVVVFCLVKCAQSKPHIQNYLTKNVLNGKYNGPYEEICTSQVYCHGELLDDIQYSRIFEDSKIFVDLKMKRSENEIVEDYKKLKKKIGGIPDNETLRNFIEENFEDENLEQWTPDDFTDNPLIVNYVADPNYKDFILNVNQIWKILGRKMPNDSKVYPDRHSSIYVPNGFFVAGGRFNELYYWDTYWIIKGALLCGMKSTVKGIIENMLHLVKIYGYMPNGSRVYYLKRSQPPLLIQMVSIYAKYAKDYKFIRDNIDILEREFQFWLNKRTVEVQKDGNVYIMAQYNTRTFGPRPESYYEDKLLANLLSEENDKNELYTRIKSAAESGWDFSSKHFNNYGKFSESLFNTNPQNFIYVELNAILQSNADILSNMFTLEGNYKKANLYEGIAKRFQIGIDALLWNDKRGIWMDYDLSTEKTRDAFFASNLAPLWMGSYDKKKRDDYGELAVNYLIEEKIINSDLSPVFLGVPTSTQNTTQQWDHPNCWPSLQAMAIFGLDQTKNSRAQKVAFNIANSWVYTNYIGYYNTGFMFEKYNAVDLGKSGNGGEYKPQTGFGWTNGLLFELFFRYGHVLHSS